MNPEQNDTGSLERDPSLNGDLPEIFIECQYDSRFRFGQLQQYDVFPTRATYAGPKDVMAVSTKRLYDRLRKILVSEKAHLRRNWVGLVLAGQVAGV